MSVVVSFEVIGMNKLNVLHATKVNNNATVCNGYVMNGTPLINYSR
ncbi:hypothetical protein [Lacibacter sp. H407]